MGVLAVALLAAAVRGPWAPGPGVLAGLLLALTPWPRSCSATTTPTPCSPCCACWPRGRSAGPGRRPHPLAPARGCGGGPGLPHEVVAGLPRAAGARGGLPRGRPAPVAPRLLQLLAAGAALVVSAGWWIVVVRMIPRADRPGSAAPPTTTRSASPSATTAWAGSAATRAPAGGGMHQSSSSIWRLVGSGGDEAGWLLPVAVVALVAVLVLTARAGRTDRVRAAAVLWGGWLVVTAGVLSVMKGIEHSYYAVQLAPALAAVVAIGGAQVWRSGRRWRSPWAWSWRWRPPGRRVVALAPPAARFALVAALLVLLAAALVALAAGRRRCVPGAGAAGPVPGARAVVDRHGRGQHQSSNVYVDPLPVTAAEWHVGRTDGAGSAGRGRAGARGRRRLHLGGGHQPGTTGRASSSRPGSRSWIIGGFSGHDRPSPAAVPGRRRARPHPLLRGRRRAAAPTRCHHGLGEGPRAEGRRPRHRDVRPVGAGRRQLLSGRLQQGHALDVRGHREGVVGPQPGEPPARLGEHGDVAGQRRGVAGHVHDRPGAGLGQRPR